jgi:hypothetical protein
VLEPGRAADLALLNWRQVAYPVLDLGFDVTVLDAVLHRAKRAAVETVVVAGEPIYRDGRFVRVNRDDALRALAESMARPPSADDEFRRALSRRVLPHVRRFYDGYLDRESRAPFYRYNSRA